MTDEFLCEASKFHDFIGKVKEIVSGAAAVEARLAAIRPYFSRLLADPDWLPAKFRRTCDTGGMGKGTASWLLYRNGEGSLSFSVLVLAPGAATPVHDHLAWGLVGLYAGEQDEEVYATTAPLRPEDRITTLKLLSTNQLRPGSFYELIPPAGDIHRVRTTGAEPSVSLHLLGNDVGCVARHRFEPDSGAVAPFRSGYTNRECES